MKYQRILQILLALALGLVIGRKSAPTAAKSTARASDNQAESRSGAGSLLSRHVEAPDQRPLRSHIREEKEPPPDRGRRISIPLDLIAKDLKERRLVNENFDSIGDRIDEALTMLNATDPEREKVKGVFTKAKSEILAAEKEHLRVTQSDSTAVELDTTGMSNVIPGIIAVAQNEIRASLSPDIGEALNDSVNWNKFYNRTDEFTPFSLTIQKTPGIGLIAYAERDGNSKGRLVPETHVPADGGSIPAARAFDERWTPFLKDVMLDPVDPRPPW